MKNELEMVTLDRIAQRYGARPSQILGVSDPWAAYQVDLTVMAVAGNAVEQAGKGLKSPGTPAKPAQAENFAQLAGQARRMKIPESGVW